MKSTTKRLLVFSSVLALSVVTISIGVSLPARLAVPVVVLGAISMTIASVLSLKVAFDMVDDWWDTNPKFRRWLEKDDEK